MVKQTMVHLTEEQLARADVEAARRGLSRSALIREARDAHLSQSRGAELDRQMLAGYDRTPQADDDAWGDLAEVADRATREAMARLAAEEARGPGGW
jgi:metal-responsive CopG/Arc/MetJ family transcriptional regulator